MSAAGEVTVGILANPASGRDIRRLVAQASVFPIAEKCSMITRLLVSLGATGVGRVLMMPDGDGIAARVRRAVDFRRPGDGVWPAVEFLDMEMTSQAIDTGVAVEKMVARGARAIVVLGGDGTHRVVAKACGDVPITPLSTGTNNVFPAIREATIAGLATGLIAVGALSTEEVASRAKALRIDVNGTPREIALVDVAISSQRWAGAKALWRSGDIEQIFVTFAEADAIGLSAIAGLVHPLARNAVGGLRVDLAAPEDVERSVLAPIAPGLIVPVGIRAIEEFGEDEPQTVAAAEGVIALDGEREIEFTSTDRVSIHLDLNGPWTIDIASAMDRAAHGGLLSCDRREGES